MAVNPHRPRLQAIGIAQRLAQVAGPDAGGQAKIAVVGQAQRLFPVGHAYQVHHRTENLFPAKAQPGVGINHQRWRNIVALRIRPHVTANQLCLLLTGFSKIGRHFCAVRLRHHRVNLAALEHTGPDL